jgi:hypothetical protein
MSPVRKAAFIVSYLAVAVALEITEPAMAQQLEPRAYAPAPVGMSIFGVTGLYTTGDVVIDPSVPIENLHARVRVVAPFYGRTFELFGKQASVGLSVPIADADATGDVLGVGRSIHRTGLGDPAFRIAVNLIGLAALTRQEFATRTRKTTVGASFSVIAPFGQYDRAKLINLGTNRWAFKPELGLSQPLGNWDFELYAGVWLFTANNDFYGGQVRRQDPLTTTQAHVVYMFMPYLWASLDFTYYTGGVTTVSGQTKNDRQNNSRTGITLVLPAARQQQLKLSWSKGVSVRLGQDFDAFGVAWQYVWF